MKFRCVQPGNECEFEADERPTHCPVCKYPFAGDVLEEVANEDPPWSEYTIGELLEYADDWELQGWNSRTPKADLIELLEAAEAAEVD